MIERKFVSEKLKEFQIQEYIFTNLKRVGHSHTKMVRTPLGEKIIIFASRPGLIVGRQGQNIKKLTRDLKKKFNLENPQIEISEIENINLDASIVAERISNSLERFGTTKFKGIGHRVMSDVMNAGALGVEIVMSGKIPSARAKSWRFYQGYLKKCGDIVSGVRIAYARSQLKMGTVGIKVSIMPADIKLPDDIKLIKKKIEVIEEIKEEKEVKKEVKEKKIEKKEEKNLKEKPKEKKEPKEEKKKENEKKRN